MSKNLLIIFTRNPELGKVKTRLAKTIGDQAALNIYKYLLNHTELTVKDLVCDKAIYYSENVNDHDVWDNSTYQKFAQNGNDLGERMLNAFKVAFDDNYEKVIIIGSDLIDLQAKHFLEAFQKLDTHDVVIGPAHDGGYYLLGMRKLHKHLFREKKWGTSSVLRDTLHDLQNLNVFLLEELNDIDIYDDIKNNTKLNSLIDSCRNT
jgi:rSAM/selenodomain-associated transferase 1